MGVHKLWDLLSLSAIEVGLDSLRGKVVAVDTSIWLYQLLHGSRHYERDNYTDEEENRQYLVGFLARICKLAHFGALPVFVYDGKAPDLKFRVIEERRKNKKKLEAQLDDARRDSVISRLYEKALEGIIYTDQQDDLIDEDGHSSDSEFEEAKVKIEASPDLNLNDHSIEHLEDLNPENKLVFLRSLLARSSFKETPSSKTVSEFAEEQKNKLLERGKLRKQINETEELIQLEKVSEHFDNPLDKSQLEGMDVYVGKDVLYMRHQDVQKNRGIIGVGSSREADSFRNRGIKRQRRPQNKNTAESVDPKLIWKILDRESPSAIDVSPIERSETKYDRYPNHRGILPYSGADSRVKGSEVLLADYDKEKSRNDFSEEDIDDSEFVSVKSVEHDIASIEHQIVASQDQNKLSLEAVAEDHRKEDRPAEHTSVTQISLSTVEEKHPPAIERESKPSQDGIPVPLMYTKIINNAVALSKMDLDSKIENLERMSRELGSDLVSMSKELLRLLGLPYIEAPWESDMHCALLNKHGVVDSVVTEDNDVLLFGAKTVFRKVFDRRNVVEMHTSRRIREYLGLDREDLIALNFFLGGDYTPGVGHVGIQYSLEILYEFFRAQSGSSLLESLENARSWAEGTTNKPVSEDFDKKFAKKKHRFVFSDDFPNSRVYSAFNLIPFYTSEDIGTLKTLSFQWKAIQLSELERFCQEKLAMETSEISQITKRIITARNTYIKKGGETNKKRRQTKLTDYSDEFRSLKAKLLRNTSLLESILKLGGHAGIHK